LKLTMKRIGRETVNHRIGLKREFAYRDIRVWPNESDIGYAVVDQALCLGPRKDYLLRIVGGPQYDGLAITLIKPPSDPFEDCGDEPDCTVETLVGEFSEWRLESDLTMQISYEEAHAKLP